MLTIYSTYLIIAIVENIENTNHKTTNMRWRRGWDLILESSKHVSNCKSFLIHPSIGSSSVFIRGKKKTVLLDYF